MPCKTPVNCRGETCRSVGKNKTKCACIVDVDETFRIRLEGVPHRYHEDHISRKRNNSLNHYYKLGTQVYSNGSSIENSGCEGSSGKRVGKIGEKTGMAADKSQKHKKKRWSKKQGIREEKFISRHWWISVISRIRSWNLNFKSTKAESYSEVTSWRMIWREHHIICRQYTSYVIFSHAVNTHSLLHITLHGSSVGARFVSSAQSSMCATWSFVLSLFPHLVAFRVFLLSLLLLPEPYLCTSTPHRSETNGIAERAVRRVKEGTSAVLLQSGLDENWCADSMECESYLRNIQDLLSEGKILHERRFGEPFKGPIIPCGSLVEYHPTTSKDESRIHQFSKKVLPGFFLGYALYAVEIWKGDILVADIEELETMDASEIYSKRQCERDDISQRRRIYFSNRRWTNQNPRRRSGTENIHLGTASTNSRRGSHWLSRWIRRVSSTTSRLTSGCRWSYERFLVHVGKLHIPPSRWTKSPTLLAERRIIPYSTEIHWRNQNYSYEFGC